MNTLCQKAQTELAALGNSERALRDQAYFKTPLRCLGVSKPEIDRLGRDLYKQSIKEAGSPSMEVLQDLWDSDIHELRTLAVVIAGLIVAKEHPLASDYPFDRWVDTCHSWDHLDALCIKVIGPMQCYDARLADQQRTWRTSSNRWARRASLVMHLPAIRKKKACYTVIEESCKRLASNEDFFIRKAIGWVLREISKVHPEVTVRIIQSVGDDLSPLSLREGTRHLDEEYLKQLGTPSNRDKV